jgi:hypothetical protein
MRITSISSIDGKSILHARDPVAVNGLFSILSEILLFSNRYPCMNIVWVMKSRRMRWMGHVAHTGERTGVYGVLVGKPVGERPRKTQAYMVGQILRWILRKWNGAAWTGLNWLRLGTDGGHL